MSNKIKDIDIKNHIYYIFDGITNIKAFDPRKIKVDEKSYENILIYYVEYVSIKDLKYMKINSVNSLYFMINKKNKYFEETNKNMHLTLVPTN